MTTARKELVDVALTRWYHCISHCVRSALLMGHGTDDRKQWIEDRLEHLTQSFAIGVGGFAVMDSHLHVVCRLDPNESRNWLPEEIMRRWIAVYPPRNLALDSPKAVNTWITQQVKDTHRVEVLRQRLSNLGWFMKALKEPLARIANKADCCRGTFWSARYKSIAILDDEALLATSIYVDLNPLAAGIAETPENSNHTSIKQRVEHARDQGEMARLAAAEQGSFAGISAAGNAEQGHWLIPIEDRRRETVLTTESEREGMIESFSLGSYLLLVDYTCRLYRNGKARLDSAAKGVFERLGINQAWSCQVQIMLGCRSLRGNFFATNPVLVQRLAKNRGRRTVNLRPQVA